MVFNNPSGIGKVPQGSWSRGYDGALTRRRSPVQFRPGPLFHCKKFEDTNSDTKNVEDIHVSHRRVVRYKGSEAGYGYLRSESVSVYAYGCESLENWNETLLNT